MGGYIWRNREKIVSNIIKKIKEKSMKISWRKNPNKPVGLRFEDLELNDTFRISGRDVVYVKCQDFSERGIKDHEFKQVELATGKIFKPTGSIVERVNVVVKVDSDEPKVYKKARSSTFGSFPMLGD